MITIFYPLRGHNYRVHLYEILVIKHNIVHCFPSVKSATYWLKLLHFKGLTKYKPNSLGITLNYHIRKQTKLHGYVIKRGKTYSILDVKAKQCRQRNRSILNTTQRSSHGVIWRTITNFPKYEVSNTGIVSSKPHYVIRNNHPVRLKGHHIHDHNTDHIRLHKSGRAYDYTIGQLVAEEFLIHPPYHASVFHKDHDSQNNNVNNLYYMQRSKWLRLQVSNQNANACLRRRPKGQEN